MRYMTKPVLQTRRNRSMSFWALKADFTVSGYYSVYYYMQEQGFEHFRSICFFAIREKNQEFGLPIWKKM